MKRTRLWILLMAATAVLAPVFGSAAEIGVTDTEIHIGQWGPQTGPAAAWGSVARGTDAYFKMINAQGGIHGRKLIHHMFDDGYNPAKTVAGVKELQEGTGMFAWVSGVGSAPGMAVKDYLMEKQIPWVGPSAGSLSWIAPPQKYLFAVYPLYYIEAQALCRHAVEVLGKKRVAIIYQNDEYGKNGVEGARKELARHKLELVAEVPVEVADSDLKPHVMELRKSNADVVLLWTNVKHAVMAVGISAAMQFQPQFMSTSTCSDFPLMMQISKGLWKGVISATFGELPDSDLPLMKQYKSEAFDKFANKDERWGLFYYAGFLFAEPAVEALKRCGRDLTREKFVSEMEKIRDFRGIGGVINFAAFDPKNPATRQGGNQVFLVECLEEGKGKKLTDWMTIAYP